MILNHEKAIMDLHKRNELVELLIDDSPGFWDVKAP